MIDKSAIPGAQPVMPDSCGDVRTHVGVEFWFFNNSAWQVIVEPPAVWVLHVNEPFVGPLGIVVQASNVESDCCFNMVPRVAVPIFEPRNHSTIELKRSD